MEPRIIVSNSFNFLEKKGKINLNSEESLKLKFDCRSKQLSDLFKKK